MAKDKSSGKRIGITQKLSPITVGTKRSANSGTSGDKREFRGSGVRSYNYTRIINGIKRTVTIRAHSVKEANSIAASQGYKSSDRDIKRRRKRK